MAIMACIRHPFCAVSHWIGAVLALLGTLLLLSLSIGKPLHLLAFGLYGTSLVALFVASGLYHSVKAEGQKERVLRNFDHAGIFLLISGSYVPVCLLALSPQMGHLLLGLQALCALIGILATFLLPKFPEVLNVVLYLLMGWMALPAVGYMLGHWPSSATWWLLAGGITYTVGAVIFSLDKPHLAPGKFSAHDLWHVFVLGGSVCHYMLMITYVVHLPSL